MLICTYFSYFYFSDNYFLLSFDVTSIKSSNLSKTAWVQDDYQVPRENIKFPILNHIFGLMSFDRLESVSILYSNITGQTTYEFILQSLQSILTNNTNKGRKIAIILDNAPTNKVPKIFELCEKIGVVLIFTSPRSPMLNPIEDIWRAGKLVLKQNRNLIW